MFNNINDNTYAHLNNASNIINLNNIRTNLQKNGYNNNPYVDKTEISSNAMELFQRDMDIKKFTQFLSETKDDNLYLDRMQELFASGVVDVSDDDVIQKLVNNDKLWQDLEL